MGSMIEKAIDRELDNFEIKFGHGSSLSKRDLEILLGLYEIKHHCGKHSEHAEHGEYEHAKMKSYRHEPLKFNDEVSEKWVHSMTGGEHWTMAQCGDVMMDNKLRYSLPVFYAVMNMLYSDYHEVFAKHNVDALPFYIDMAKAWIDDADAPKDKTALYYENVIDRK